MDQLLIDGETVIGIETSVGKAVSEISVDETVAKTDDWHLIREFRNQNEFPDFLQP